MEIGPIFRALTHQKSRFWLITIEIALTLAIVANCLNMIADERAKIQRPTGLDEQHLLVVGSEPFVTDLEEETYQRVDFEEDLRAINALPGVRSVTAVSAIPLSGGGSAHGRRPVGSDLEVMIVPVIWVGAHALETLGVELAEGRDFVEADFLEDQAETGGEASRNVILTRAMADALFPDGDALGKAIDSDDDSTPPETIVGIIAQMHNHWPHSPWPSG